MNAFPADSSPGTAGSFNHLCRAYSDLERRVAQLERRADPWRSVWTVPSVPLAGAATTAPPPGVSRQTSPIPAYDLLGRLNDGSGQAEPDQRLNTAPPSANNVRFGDGTGWPSSFTPAGPSRQVVGFADTGPLIHGLGDRTLSHRSEGFHSTSASQSVRSVGSGRPSTTAAAISDAGLAGLSGSPVGLAGISTRPSSQTRMVGKTAIPAAVRCGLLPDCRADSVVMAAISSCEESVVPSSLLERLGLGSLCYLDSRGKCRVNLPIVMIDAVELAAGSGLDGRLSSFGVTFAVVGDRALTGVAPIVLGYDFLNAHSVDVLFSSGSIRISSGGRAQVAVPFAPVDDQIGNRAESAGCRSSVGVDSNGSSSALLKRHASSTTSLSTRHDGQPKASELVTNNAVVPAAGVPSAIDVDVLTASCDRRFDSTVILSSRPASDESSPAESRSGKEASESPSRVGLAPASVPGPAPTSAPIPTGPAGPLNGVSPPTRDRPAGPAAMAGIRSGSQSAVNGSDFAGMAKTSYRAAVAQRTQQPKPKPASQRAMLVFRPNPAKPKDNAAGPSSSTAAVPPSSRLAAGSSGRMSFA